MGKIAAKLTSSQIVHAYIPITVSSCSVFRTGIHEAFWSRKRGTSRCRLEIRYKGHGDQICAYGRHEYHSFAIRGTQTFMDWAVNLNSAPASPEGFLDDPGNFCHAGFLTVAKKMIKPVAARLRHLLQEDPNRSKCSLLITGHSAGGAVASLLYSHMLATTPQAESELNILTGCFKRIHCVSFGAPPVSLLPLSRPSNPNLRKSIFLSFVNEGDPVPRADKAYVRSLLDLFSTPAPGQVCAITPQKFQPLVSNLKAQSSSLTLNKMRPTPKKSKSLPVN